MVLFGWASSLPLMILSFFLVIAEILVQLPLVDWLLDLTQAEE